MYASKENARKAYEALHEHSKNAGCIVQNSKTLIFVEQFLIAVERKLPTEAAYRRARKRTKLANG